MKNSSGEVIYVGKAKSLRKRLNNYLGRDLDAKTQALVANIDNIELRLSQTEAMALIIEASLIQQYKPKYNIALRDDKSFPFVKITHEKFPAICITRKKEADGARYFGPYISNKLLREALKTIRRYFPYRSCRQLPKEACMYYRIGLSLAPCIGKISPQEYAKTIEDISLILEGKTDTLIEKLARQMQEKSGEHKFEEAAKKRDQINALSAIGQSRPGISRQEEINDLKSCLNLKKIPLRIETFDISNMYGKEATGSMVSFYKGMPDKDNYRRFRIKTVNRIDDYGMLSEVVARRYSRLIKEKLPLPDLILIDGGKGHLLTAYRELKKLALRIGLISIAKEKENIYCLGKSLPVKLREGSPALNLIRRMRDEAHRFAVSYHHVLRRKKIMGE